MERSDQNPPSAIYRPVFDIVRITTRQALRRLAIARIDEPERACGIAKRIGYTNTTKVALALYRLNLQTERGRLGRMLPSLYVVDEGIFVDYQQWLCQHDHECDHSGYGEGR